MSFQGYMDTILSKTGKSPDEFLKLAEAKGFFNPPAKAGVFIEWLKTEFDLGRGHSMALVQYFKNKGKLPTPKK
jgi:hypothetical protein